VTTSAICPSFDRRVVLVTGANSGIGNACVVSLLAQGCIVAAADITTSALDALSDDNLFVDRVDITDADAVAACVSSTRARTGRIDGLVASADIEPEDDSVDAHSASKGGVLGLGRVMANEYAPRVFASTWSGPASSRLPSITSCCETRRPLHGRLR